MRHYLFSILLIFASLSAEENFLLVNGNTNEIVMEFGPHINERISPCSSFKITLSLVGYDDGILLNETNPTWDFQEGYDDWLPSWRVPQTPLSWMQTSCVWYSKVLSVKLGLKKMEDYLVEMEYGNMDMSGGVAPPGDTTVAWINSSLKISPREQVDFLQRMVLGKLPLCSCAIRMTKAITFKEELENGWKLFGKTGWSGSESGKELEHGWFVGWIEKDEDFFPFAYLIREKKIDLGQRIPRVKQLITESNVNH